MEDIQINGQRNNKEAYCPNMFFDNGTVSIGEFKTLDDAMNFPIKEIWCINRKGDNKFQAYKDQGTRILVICDWSRSIQDSLKFVLTLIHQNGKIHYYDLNDLPLYPEERKNQYEGSLGDEATYMLYHLIENKQYKTNRNMKQTIKLRESELKRMIAESVKRLLREKKEEYDWSEFEKDPEGKKEFDVNNSWEYYDYVHSTPKEVRPYDDAYWNLANRGDNNTLLWDLQNNYWDGSSDIDTHMFYDVNPDSWKADKEKEEQDNQKKKNQWEKDERWKKAADSRPLHRKGSLNREMKESRINRAVNEVVRRILKG